MKTALQALVLAPLISTVAHAVAGVIYVDANGKRPAAPYRDWTTAAKTIQDAVDVASTGDEIVATKGFYATGGRALGVRGL
jgi:hypothetical protein